jgi:hypothetical protein
LEGELCERIGREGAEEIENKLGGGREGRTQLVVIITIVIIKEGRTIKERNWRKKRRTK